MQGFNMGRYHAPASLDTNLSIVPAKRARITSTPKAAPTIRFEMPFAIWCSTCPSSSTSCLIGQGVRFNALKTKVGNYFSTPIWQFRMKHTACGGWIEIRTDPKNTEYVVTEGARKRDTGSDEIVAERIGGVLVGDEAEKEKRRQDAFAAFEGKKEDKERAKGDAKRIEVLQSLKQRDWADVDAANRRLRSSFRVGRKAREKDAEGVERLKDSMGLGIDFVEEDENDKRRAGFIEFGDLGEGVDGHAATTKPLFGSRPVKQEKGKAEPKAKMRRNLQEQLTVNTRAVVDPFTSSFLAGTSSRSIQGIKRKEQHMPSTPSVHVGTGQHVHAKINPAQMGVLVDYDSD